MPSEVSSMPVIDADSHWTEPPNLWSSRAPAHLRNQVLRVERSDKGVDRWVFDDGEIMGPGHYAVYRTLRDTNTVLYTDSGPRCHGLQVSATFEGTGRIVDQSS